MLLTGTVYSLLLVNVDVQTPVPWVNFTLHYLMPVAMLTDWLLDALRHCRSDRPGCGWCIRWPTWRSA